MLRLPQYDYSSVGAYFVTICTHDRRHLFGDIVDGTMKLNQIGEIVRSVWDELPEHYPHMECDAFIVMPNHVHAIVALTDIPVGAGFKPAPSDPVDPTVGRAGLKPAPTRRGLPEIIRALKTFSARRINVVRGATGAPLWQRNYYEHVIRNDADLDRIRCYISENPIKWAFDEENVGAGLKPAPTNAVVGCPVFYD